MGLIGMLMIPMTTGTDLVLAGPQDFLAAPSRWAQWISDFQCSITAGPNFSYALSARAMRRGGDLDLSRWRVALNGAEPIEPSSVEDWLAAGAPHGLRVGTAFCAYGMAESTVGITFPKPGQGMIVDSVDGRVLETDNYAADGGPLRPRRPPAAVPGQGHQRPGAAGGGSHAPGCRCAIGRQASSRCAAAR